MTSSPRRLKEQVKDTVSELPIQAARLAVMGVGRALLLTDRVRKDYREARESGLSPVLGRLKNDAENLTGMVVGKVAGNGRSPEAPRSATAGSEISVGKPKPATPPAARTRPATAPPTRPAASARPKPTPKPTPKPPTAKPAPAAKPAAAGTTAKPKPKPAARPKAKPAAEKPAAPKPSRAKASAHLPISGYDEATLASVRARLRGLDAKQVGELRDYERTHAARADFLRMYENRIAKLREA
jgi:hypothetical protein